MGSGKRMRVTAPPAVVLNEASLLCVKHGPSFLTGKNPGPLKVFDFPARGVKVHPASFGEKNKVRGIVIPVSLAVSELSKEAKGLPEGLRGSDALRRALNKFLEALIIGHAGNSAPLFYFYFFFVEGGGGGGATLLPG